MLILLTSTVRDLTRSFVSNLFFPRGQLSDFYLSRQYILQIKPVSSKPDAVPGRARQQNLSAYKNPLNFSARCLRRASHAGSTFLLRNSTLHLDGQQSTRPKMPFTSHRRGAVVQTLGGSQGSESDLPAIPKRVAPRSPPCFPSKQPTRHPSPVTATNRRARGAQISDSL